MLRSPFPHSSQWSHCFAAAHTAPLLTGLPLRLLCHWQRSTPPSISALRAAGAVANIINFCIGTKKRSCYHDLFFVGIRQLPIFPSGTAWSQCVGANAVLLLPASLSSASLSPPPAAFGFAVSQARTPYRFRLRLGEIGSLQYRKQEKTSIWMSFFTHRNYQQQIPTHLGAGTRCGSCPPVRASRRSTGSPRYTGAHLQLRRSTPRVGAAWDHRKLADGKTKHPANAGCFVLVSGSYLSSQAVSSSVFSAYKGLTSVFGMGTGGSP